MTKVATFYDHVRTMAHQENVSMTEAMKRVKDLGIELLEVPDSSVIGREDEIGQELSDAGLDILSIDAHFDFGRNTDVDVQSKLVLKSVHRLGVRKLLVIPGFFRVEDKEIERERQIQNMIDCLNRLADQTSKYGITLMIEEYDSVLAFYSSISGVRRLLDSCPKLYFCFDTGNFRFMAEDELDGYQMLRSKIAHVHLKDRAYTPGYGPPINAVDNQLLYPAPVGMGSVRIDELLKRLRQDGYQGAYTIEHYNADNMQVCLERSVSYLKKQLSL